VYEERLDARRGYLLEMTSDAFQSYLRVEDARGNPLLQAGGTRTARAVFVPAETGSYRVIVTSRAGDKLGPFRLTIRATAAKAGAAARLNGRFEPTDPYQRVPARKYARRFDLKLSGGQ